MADTWNELLDFLADSDWLKPLLPAAKLAAKDGKLKNLYPFTSHLALGFSKTKTYPHTRGIPFIVPKEDGTFEVTTGNHTVLARGTAEQAIAVVKAIAACNTEATVSIPRKKTARSPRGRTKSAVKTP